MKNCHLCLRIVCGIISFGILLSKNYVSARKQCSDELIQSLTQIDGVGSAEYDSEIFIAKNEKSATAMKSEEEGRTLKVILTIDDDAALESVEEQIENKTFLNVKLLNIQLLSSVRILIVDFELELESDVDCVTVDDPIKCADGCEYYNECAARALGQETSTCEIISQCPTNQGGGVCGEIYDPVTCSDGCEYSNECVAEAAGQKGCESQTSLCFSSHTFTQVKGKGTLPISEVEVGDRVLTAKGSYEMVYSFDHRHRTKHTAFLQIIHGHRNNYQYESSTADNGMLPLEVTAGHMLFLNGKIDPVPARSVRIGDQLSTVLGPSTVVEIHRIARKGFFNPLTTDGTIIASGVFTSSYTSKMMPPSKKNRSKNDEILVEDINNSTTRNSIEYDNSNGNTHDNEKNDGEEWAIKVNGIGNTKLTLANYSHQLLVHKLLKPYRIVCSQILLSSSSLADGSKRFCQPLKNQEYVVLSKFASNLQHWLLRLQQTTDEKDKNMLLRNIVVFFIIVSAVVADALLSYPFFYFYSFVVFYWYYSTTQTIEKKKKKKKTNNGKNRRQDNC